MPCSLSNWTIELNAYPDGSRPTLSQSELPTRRSASASVKTFDTDWIEKGSSASPELWKVPSGRASAKPSLSGATLARAGIESATRPWPRGAAARCIAPSIRLCRVQERKSGGEGKSGAEGEIRVEGGQ